MLSVSTLHWIKKSYVARMLYYSKEENLQCHKKHLIAFTFILGIGFAFFFTSVESFQFSKFKIKLQEKKLYCKDMKQPLTLHHLWKYIKEKPWYRDIKLSLALHHIWSMCLYLHQYSNKTAMCMLLIDSWDTWDKREQTI